MTEIELILSAVSAVGFPIVGFYLMYQMCKDTISKNTDALHELKEVVLSLKQ
jgi:hypothetical protein